MRRVSGTQLDGRLVELFVEMLADKTLAYRHGEDADFEAELALDKRIHDYVSSAIRRATSERLTVNAPGYERPRAQQRPLDGAAPVASFVTLVTSKPGD